MISNKVTNRAQAPLNQATEEVKSATLPGVRDPGLCRSIQRLHEALRDHWQGVFGDPRNSGAHRRSLMAAVNGVVCTDRATIAQEPFSLRLAIGALARHRRSYEHLDQLADQRTLDRMYLGSGFFSPGYGRLINSVLAAAGSRAIPLALR